MLDTAVIIVLGNKLGKESIHAELKGRIDVALILYTTMSKNEKTNKLFLLTGGRTNQKVQYTEAELMKKYCIENGIPGSKIIIETKSLDTMGNAFFTRKIVDEIENVSDIYVVSSCYHMDRVDFIFSMCYGIKYNLHFNYCHSSHNFEKRIKENESLKLAKEFFNGIKPGDFDKIEKKIK